MNVRLLLFVFNFSNLRPANAIKFLCYDVSTFWRDLSFVQIAVAEPSLKLDLNFIGTHLKTKHICQFLL